MRPQQTNVNLTNQAKGKWLAMLGALVTLIIPGTALADGAIYGPELMTKKLKRQYPTYTAPRIWLYDDSGATFGDAKGYPLAQKIDVPEGWYQVEVGNERQKKNRARLFVAEGKITVLPMGLALLTTDPESKQPTDLCRTWDGAFEVALPLGDGPGHTVGSNFSAKRAANGAIQMLAGYYRILWNGHWIAAQIKANEALIVPTNMAGPMSGPGYKLHVGKTKEEARKNPGLKMCERRPTRVLARGYWVSILRRLSQPPFREYVWRQYQVSPPDETLYSKLKVKSVRGKLNTGEGHAPLLMWEIPDTPAIPTEPSAAPTTDN